MDDTHPLPAPPEETPPPVGGDFLRWAMGSSARAAGVVLLPVAAGVILGVIATFLHFGMRYPTFMWEIPWDLSGHYECFVLPRNVARCCLLFAPLAAALVLLTQPRFRSLSPQSRVPGPRIGAHYWLVAAVGVMLMIVIPTAFDITGSGWFFACRIQDLYGIGGRLALTAMIALISPAAIIAALVLAYHFRRRLAVAGAQPAAETLMRPIGLLLIAAGLIYVNWAIWNIERAPGDSMISAILYIASGYLIMKGSLGVARLMGWLSAATVAMSVGEVLAAPIHTPLGLVRARLHVAPIATAFEIATLFGAFALAVWVYQAVRAPAILAARKATRRSVARPWTGFAFGALLEVYQIALVIHIEHSDIAEEARRAARDKYGSQYTFQITGTGISEDGAHGVATLTAYTDTELIDAQVDWPRR